MKTPGTIKREGKVWAWSIGDKAGYCATKADALNDMAIAAGAKPLAKPYFCAALDNGQIILKWFADSTDAAIYHGAMHLSRARKLALSPKLVSREAGERLIRKAWGSLPVLHVEG